LGAAADLGAGAARSDLAGATDRRRPGRRQGGAIGARLCRADVDAGANAVRDPAASNDAASNDAAPDNDIVASDIVASDLVTPDIVTPDIVASDLVTPGLVTSDIASTDIACSAGTADDSSNLSQPGTPS